MGNCEQNAISDANLLKTEQAMLKHTGIPPEDIEIRNIPIDD